MLKFVWDRVARQQRPPRAAVPEGERVYAIGDIHGRLDLLDALLEMIDVDNAAREPARVVLIFLGDLIDRGPQSAHVVERLRHIHDKTCAASTRFILGNHEEIFLAVLAGDTDALRLFHRIGGYETLLSYGIPNEEYRELPSDELVERIAALVPQTHIEFLKSFEDLIVLGDYAFVHAGVRPGRALSDQKAKDLRWIRNEFLRHSQTFEKVVVHGHSISHDIDILPNRIGIDTGAYASGKLTALGLEGHDQWVVQTSPSPEDHASGPRP